MTAMIGRREFLGTAAAAGLLAGCKVSNGPGAQNASGDLGAQLQAIAEGILADFPQLQKADIRACLAFAAERERRVVSVPAA